MVDVDDVNQMKPYVVYQVEFGHDIDDIVENQKGVEVGRFEFEDEAYDFMDSWYERCRLEVEDTDKCVDTSVMKEIT